MNIAHTADFHYGARQYGMPDREHDFYEAGHRVFDNAIASRVNVIILAGDIFDIPKPSAATVKVLKDDVDRARAAGIMVLGIDGNHDVAGGDWLRVCGAHVLSTEPIALDGIFFAGIPSCRPTVFRATLADMAAAGVKCDVLVIHQAIAEMADFGTELSVMDILPPLQAMGVRYCAMGDIHNYREMVVGGVRFCYPGSPELTARDERPDKSMELIDISATTLKTFMMPLTTRPFLELQIRQQADIDTVLAKAQQQPKPLLLLWYEPADKELAQRAEAVLDGKALYRMCPLSKGGAVALVQQMQKDGVDRRGALEKLREAIATYFEAGSEQYELVLQFLKQPDLTGQIIRQYLVTKGIA